MKKAEACGLACPKSNLYQPIIALDFSYAFAKHRSELKFDKSISQSAVRIQMMSHHMSHSCETLLCPSDFHDTLLAPLLFISIALGV